MRLHPLAATLVILVGAPALAAQQDSSLVTLERLFTSDDFSPDFFGPARWLRDSGYTTFERAPDGRGRDLVRTDPASGQKQVLLAAAKLIPTGDSVPLRVENFTFSTDGQRVLLYTNSTRVWRPEHPGRLLGARPRDRKAAEARRLGGAAVDPHVRQVLAPTADRVAYVRENNLYVERLDDGKITRLTTDGSRTTINGTFDWVYEEEFDASGRFPLEPRRQADRLLAARRLGRARFPADQQHRLALLLHDSGAVPQGGDHQLSLPGRRGERRWRKDPLAADPGRSPQHLPRADGVGRQLGRSGAAAPQPAAGHAAADAGRRQERQGAHRS